MSLKTEPRSFLLQTIIVMGRTTMHTAEDIFIIFIYIFTYEVILFVCLAVGYTNQLKIP